MNKTDLIQKIKQLEGITADERSYLINLVNTKKKYGLVWEDKPENVEEQLRESLPVLKEVKEKRILAKDLTKIQHEKKAPELFEANNHTILKIIVQTKMHPTTSSSKATTCTP